MKKNQFDPGLRIKQVFCLAVIFGVLWVKEYLWCAFFLAGLLYFWETLLIALFRATQESLPAPTPRRRSKPRREMMPPPAWTKEDAEEIPPGGGEDFREPPPGRPASRKR